MFTIYVWEEPLDSGGVGWERNDSDIPHPGVPIDPVPIPPKFIALPATLPATFS